MEARLIVNGFDLSTLVAKNGIQQSETIRNESTLVALDGTERWFGVKKQKLSVRLQEMSDGTLSKVVEALERQSPAAVTYPDKRHGESSRTFRVADLTAGTKVVECGKTYWDGVSFSLIER